MYYHHWVFFWFYPLYDFVNHSYIYYMTILVFSKLFVKLCSLEISSIMGTYLLRFGRKVCQCFFSLPFLTKVRDLYYFLIILISISSFVWLIRNCQKISFFRVKCLLIVYQLKLNFQYFSKPTSKLKSTPNS